MSRLVLLEVAMKKDFPDLYDLYFGGQVLGCYYDRNPFLLVGTTHRLTKEGRLEILLGCPQLKVYFKELFGIELRIYVTTEKGFNGVLPLMNRFSSRGKAELVNS